MSDVAERVKKVIVDCSGVADERVTDDVTFDELGLDSLERVEIGLGLEEEFGHEIPDEALEQLVTPGDAIKLIEGMTR